METVEDIDFIIDEHVVITVGEKTRGARIEVLHEMVDINNFLHYRCNLYATI